MSYEHKSIDAKWQKYWEENKLFKDNFEQEKYYILDMFPYPSGAGLHVGHPEGYTATDIISRYWRMKGKNILHPMGWDAFGLPAENYAIKTKTHPEKTTRKNIQNFKRQIKSLGFSYNWEREITTCEAEYYRWTQWWFLFLYEQGLAYKKKAPVNWCESCKTILANEQVIDDKCDRCKSAVIQKEMEQWFFKITEFIEDKDDNCNMINCQTNNLNDKIHFADCSNNKNTNFNLNGGIHSADWPQVESDVENLFLITWNTFTPYLLKEELIPPLNKDLKLLKNWKDADNFICGEKIFIDTEKAQIILDGLREAEKNAKNEFKLLEAVITENHVHAVISLTEEKQINEIVKKLKGISSRRYIQYLSSLNGEINSSIKNKQIKFNQTKNCNQLWREGYHFSYIKNLENFQNVIGYLQQHLKKERVAKLLSCSRVVNNTIKKNGFTSGLISGLDKIDWPSSTKIAQKNWIGKSEGAEIDFKIKNSELKIKIFTTRPDTLFGATFIALAPEHPLVNQITTEQQRSEVEKYTKASKNKTPLERQSEKEKTGVFTGAYAINPINNKEIPIWIADYVLMGYGTGAIMSVPAHDERDFEFAKKYKLPIIPVISGGKENVCFEGEGKLINSEKFNDLNSNEAKQKIITWLEEKNIGKKTTTYKLRDWSVGRQRYWGAPIPMIYCDDCGEVPVPEKDLPILLPKDVDFVPTGKSPLVNSKTFHDVKCPKCDKLARRESDTMDTFVCSSWYFFAFANASELKNEKNPMLTNSKNLIPVNLYIGGAEHTVLHLLYARFFTKVLHHAGKINFDEPFLKLRHQGMVLAEDGRKMSKSLGNVINPDEIVEKYGADTMRLYEMFMGPFAESTPWSTQGIEGIRRFLERVWRLFDKKIEPKQDGACPACATPELKRLLHQTIKKVTEDIENLHFNTAISQMMVFVNYATSLPILPKGAVEKFLQILSPFAPHLTEELWQKLGHKNSIALEKWPNYNPQLIEETTIQFVIQINGKLRDTLSIAKDISKEEAIRLAKDSKKIISWLENKKIIKEIFVQGKLVNFVVVE